MMSPFFASQIRRRPVEERSIDPINLPVRRNTYMKSWRWILLVATFSWIVSSASAKTAKFDFDTCTPILTAGMSTPLDQNCGGVKAHFSSPYDGMSGGGYSVQNHDTTFYTLHLFSGNYLMPNGLDPGALDVNFTAALGSITFPFATADFHQNEVPTTIQMDAYFNATLVGSKQAHGTYGSDTMPMGTLTFDSGGKPFNRIEIWIPPQPLGSSDVLVDTLSVKTLASMTAR
jgi:hypothetical protein